MAEELEAGKIVAKIILDNSKLEEGAKDSEEILRDLDNNAGKTKPKLDIDNTQAVKKAKETTDAVDDVAKSEEDAKKAGDQLGEGSKKLGEEFTVLKGVAADLVSTDLQKISSELVNIGKDVIKTGQDFTYSMSEVQAISGATAEELERLTAVAREYGAKTQFSASEAAQALKFMALAGWDAETSISALPGVLDLAAASGMELAHASDMVTDYLSAFGMAADQATYMADLLTYAQGHSNTSAQQLGEAWGNCAANMHAAGQDIETVTAILEAMANQGKKGSEAGTAMAAMIRDLTNHMKDGKITIGDTDIAVQDAAGNFRDLTEIIGDVGKAVDGLGSAERSAALSDVFTVYSITGINMALTEGVDKISEYEEALRNSSGSAADAAKTMNNNLTGDLKTMGSAFDELKLKIYDDAEAPIRNIVQAVTKYGVPALEALTAHINEIIPVVTAAASAWLGYKAAVGIQSLISSVVAAVKALTVAKVEETAATEGAKAAQDALNASQAANPIGLVVSAIGLLIGGLTSYAMIAGTATDKTDALHQAMNNAAQTANKTKADAEKETIVIQTLGNEYDRLRQKESLTEYEKKRLGEVSEQLSGKLGLTTEELRSQSGEYRNLSQEIENVTAAIKNQAEQEAIQHQIEAAIETRLKAEEAMYLKMSELQEKGLYDEDGNRNFAVAMTEEGRQLETEYAKLAKTRLEAAKTVDFYTGKLNEAVSKEEEAAVKTTATSASVEKQGKVSEKTRTKFSELAEAAHKLSEGEETLEDRLTNANKELENNKTALRSARDEAKELEKKINNVDFNDVNLSGLYDIYKNQLDQAQQNVAQLETEQFKLRQNIAKIKKEMKDAEEAAMSFVDRMKKLHSSLSDLAGTYDRLTQGQALDLDALLSLTEKYPEYTDMLLAAAGNADKQREAVEKLFEAKKNEYILNQQKTIDDIEASNKTAETEIENIRKRCLAIKEYAQAAGQLFGLTIPDGAFVLNDEVTKRLEELHQQIKDGSNEIEKYKKNITFIQGLDIDSFKTSGSGSSTKSALQKYLDYLDDLKELDQLTLKSEIASYEWALKNYNATADEKHTIDVRLYNARKKLQEQEDAAVKARAENYLKQIDNKKNLDELTLKSEIASYEYGLKNFKLTADQKQTYEVRLYNARKKLREQEEKKEQQRQETARKKREEEIKALDKLGDAVTAALRSRYEQQKALEEKRIDESIASWKEWEEKTCDAIQGQITALDQLKNAHEEENKREEYENKRKALELQKKYEKDDYNRRQLEKELASLDKAENERLFELQIEQQKKALQEQAENVRQTSQERQAALQKEKDDMSEQYETRMSDFALQEQARKTILENSQADIIKLINTYAKDYEMLGSTLGESLYSGISKKVRDIVGYVDTVAQKTDTQSERVSAAMKLQQYFTDSGKRLSSTKSGAAAFDFAEMIGGIRAYQSQLTAVAGSAAEPYYTQKNYYADNQNESTVKNVTVNMTVNLSDKSGSPIELRRQFEDISYQLAKEVAGA